MIAWQRFFGRTVNIQINPGESKCNENGNVL